LTPTTSDASQAIDQGLAYLLKQQGIDGGWHSQTYGQLKGGSSVTALMVSSLSQLPASPRAKCQDAITKALAFLEPGFRKKQTVASPDGSLDFPTYGCALLIAALDRLRLTDKAAGEQRRLATRYLLRAQLLPNRGFAPDHPAHGGWDFLGEGEASGITTGTNISIVAHALEALETDRTPEADQARLAATGWLTRCQQADGGFAFTPEPMSLNNKAEFLDEARTKPRSYGTATCDGIRAWLAVGKTKDDAPVQQAVAWLVKRPALETVPGFEHQPAEADWRRGLRYYYYHSLAVVLPLLPASEQASRGQELQRILTGEQQSDGRWQNESDRMRENDPLIATPLCLSTLARLKQ
jgi:hypothetical protein